jgi:hypothetical protein
MITLDPEFLGGFAPQSQLTEGVDRDTMPFARQPRLRRLHVQGKADGTEDASENGAVVDCTADSSNPPKRNRMGQEKRKMRGKDNSLKRFVSHFSSVIVRSLNWVRARYLRKQRKNVVDPKVVSQIPLCKFQSHVRVALSRLQCVRHSLNVGLKHDRLQTTGQKVRVLSGAPHWTGSAIGLNFSRAKYYGWITSTLLSVSSCHSLHSKSNSLLYGRCKECPRLK